MSIVTWLLSCPQKKYFLSSNQVCLPTLENYIQDWKFIEMLSASSFCSYLDYFLGQISFLLFKFIPSLSPFSLFLNIFCFSCPVASLAYFSPPRLVFCTFHVLVFLRSKELVDVSNSSASRENIHQWNIVVQMSWIWLGLFWHFSRLICLSLCLHSNMTSPGQNTME